MMKLISDFVGRFGAKVSLDETLIVKRQHRYFLLNENLRRFTSNDFFYGGTYLGKTKHGKFFPSFSLLDLITGKNVNSIVVDKKTEWLFICGRDIFKQGITKALGSRKKGNYTLILNSHGECLGFGRILHNLDGKKADPAVQNVLDIGDFLRREK
jgi:ribosome biogenesis protein Nip4